MMTNRLIRTSLCKVALVVFVAGCATAPGSYDPLPSWNEGPAKRSIIDFVRVTTSKTSSTFVPPEARVATFDNDGTLWVEQPLYPQITFAIERVAELAPQHPEWKDEQPFKAILANDREVIESFSLKDLEKIFAATHSNLTEEGFQSEAAHWLAASRHPRFNRPYTELAYQPMLEVLRYFRANGFKTYIATGGGQDFVRTFADRIYGIPPEQIVGTVGKVQFEYAPDGKPVLMKQPEVLFLNDRAGKPEGINMMIGRRPLAAFGNSNGDRQMLEYTQAGDGARLMMLVHHDDAEREYAYDAESRVGRFTADLMTEARTRNWVVISMKNDWKTLFPWQRGAAVGSVGAADSGTRTAGSSTAVSPAH
jgi:phosphoglycolate phosphatase-like HAD superfamily hydrolase